MNKVQIFLPVSDTVVSVVGQSVVVRSPPSDGSPWSTAHSTPQGDAVTTFTHDIAERAEKLWRSCRETQVKDFLYTNIYIYIIYF